MPPERREGAARAAEAPGRRRAAIAPAATGGGPRRRAAGMARAAPRSRRPSRRSPWRPSATRRPRVPAPPRVAAGRAGRGGRAEPRPRRGRGSRRGRGRGRRRAPPPCGAAAGAAAAAAGARAAPTTRPTSEAEEDRQAEARPGPRPTTRTTGRRRGRPAPPPPPSPQGRGRRRGQPTTAAHGRQDPRAGAARDEVQGVTGSTRLEAKRQRRRDGREQRRTRPPILSESEFLARREAVDRVMVVRQRGDRTQIAVLEDGILVEHYVTGQSSATMVGNVYLGKVQNVLPSMEAAFVDVGRGRNAVLYAGEVNWDATGLEGRTRSIEQALKSGDSVLVQVTKDPIGHKGARLTSHIALSGRHLVYVPNGNASGISRKLSDIERKRLRDVLKNLVPDGAGVIVRPPPRAPARTSWPATSSGCRRSGRTSRPRRPRAAPGAALRGARPGHPGGPGPVQRGLPGAGHPGRRRVRHGRVVPGARLARPGRAAAPARRHRRRVRRVRSTSRSSRGWTARSSCPPAAPGDRPHRGDDRGRRQHRQVHRRRAATSRRRSPATTSRRPRRSCASCGCATSAASW